MKNYFLSFQNRQVFSESKFNLFFQTVKYKFHAENPLKRKKNTLMKLRENFLFKFFFILQNEKLIQQQLFGQIRSICRRYPCSHPWT